MLAVHALCMWQVAVSNKSAGSCPQAWLLRSVLCLIQHVLMCLCLQVGSKVTTAVDTFSFGIMMWELYTGQRAYSGLGRDAIIDRVYKKQSRPIFPSGVPALYSNLARSCWETDPQLRPNFHVILARLQEMLTAFQSGAYAGASAAAEAVRERLEASAAQQQQQQPQQSAFGDGAVGRQSGAGGGGTVGVGGFGMPGAAGANSAYPTQM